jgi:thiamine biosynthesis lipoprotein
MSVHGATTRRSFLNGRALAKSVGDLIDRAANPGLVADEWTSPTRASSRSLITASRRAMACQFQVALPAVLGGAVAAASSALDTIERLEQVMTVYDDSSAVSRINREAATGPISIDAELFGLLSQALVLNRETDGAFDVAAGALIKAWGFFRGPKRVPDAAELARVMETVGSRHVTLDPAAHTISLNRPGVELNLGAIGKGFALDRAAEVLKQQWGVPAALLHGGRSSILAIGTLPGEPTEDAGWLVAIAHPSLPGESIATVRLRDAALGTSGATLQYFEVGGRRFGHILDPRTGYPAQNGTDTCVSVIAPSAALADALSTAFFILGPGPAAEYCGRHPEVGAVVVSPSDPSGIARVAVLGCARPLVQLNPRFAADDCGGKRGAL